MKYENMPKGRNKELYEGRYCPICGRPITLDTWIVEDEDEPQTEEPPMDEYYKDHDEFYDCDRYVITNDEGERAYNCIGCQTDCSWK